MRPSPLVSVAALALGALVVRIAILLVLGPELAASGGEPLGWLVLALDGAALVAYLLAIVAGQLLGQGFGSVMLATLLLGLPIAGMGAGADALFGPDASARLGLGSLAALGAGLCTAVPARNERFAQGLLLVLGGGALALSAKLATEDGATGRWVIALPFALVALAALVLRPLRPLPAAASPLPAAPRARRSTPLTRS